MSATAPEILARVSALSLVCDIVDVFLGDRVEADDAAVEVLVELEVLILRALHVQNVRRVVVMRFKCVYC